MEIEAFTVRWLPLPFLCHWRHGAKAGWHYCKAPQSFEEVLRDVRRASSEAVRLRSGNVKLLLFTPLFATCPSRCRSSFAFNRTGTTWFRFLIRPPTFSSFLLFLRDTPEFPCVPSARGIPRFPRSAHYPPAFRRLHSTSPNAQRLRLPLSRGHSRKNMFLLSFSNCGGLGFSPKIDFGYPNAMLAKPVPSIPIGSSYKIEVTIHFLLILIKPSSVVQMSSRSAVLISVFIVPVTSFPQTTTIRHRFLRSN